jgi:hypothetical protein
MTPQYLVGTRYISSVLPTRVISITLTVLFVTFFSGYHHLHAQDDSTILYPGVHQAEDWRVTKSPKGEIITLDGAEFGAVLKSMDAAFTVYGTNIWVRLPVTVEPTGTLFDGKYGQGIIIPDGKNWFYVVFPSSLVPEFHQIHVGAAFYPATIDSITVLNRSFENLFPYIAAVGITIGMTLFVVISALWERWRK